MDNGTLAPLRTPMLHLPVNRGARPRSSTTSSSCYSRIRPRGLAPGLAPSQGLSTLLSPSTLARLVYRKLICEMDYEDIITTRGTNENVTVILFGWAGCKDRYLAKYAAVYDEAGYTTIRFTMPIQQVRSYSSYKAFARWFYTRTLQTTDAHPRQLFFHVFSMNGCSLFTALWDVLQKEGRRDIQAATRGIVFDSCPAFVNPSQTARALSIATLPPPSFHAALREFYRGVLLTYFSLHHALIWLRSHWERRVWQRHFAFFHLLELEDLPKATLFIYGPADDICSHTSIERAARHFAKRAGDQGVHMLRLLNSPHVQHLRSEPKAYRAAVLRFIVLHDEHDESTPPDVPHLSYTVRRAADFPESKGPSANDIDPFVRGPPGNGDPFVTGPPPAATAAITTTDDSSRAASSSDEDEHVPHAPHVSTPMPRVAVA